MIVKDNMTLQGNHPLVYVILVNWNRFDDTAECISSLNKLAYSNFRIIVVDNGSSDDSVSRFKRQFPRISLVELKMNLGFAAGCNLGIRDAIRQGAEYVWLLNNDTIVDPGALSAMVGVAKRSEAGITGSKILYAGRPETIWAMGGVFNVNTGDARHIQDEKGGPQNDSEKLYLPGCSMLISRSCLEATGFLDESYFHLGEDVDYCLRAAQNGYKLFVCRDAMIWHKVSSSMTSFSPLYNYYEQRNRLLLMSKYHFARKPILFVSHFMKRIVVALAMGIRHPFKNTLFIMQGVRDSSKGITGPRFAE